MARLVNPSALGAPVGYSNGVIADAHRLLFVSGQVAWDAEHRIVSQDFVSQFERALDNFMLVVEQAGGRVESVVQMRLFVTDKSEYEARLKEIGSIWRSRMGRHFPAMTLVQVAALLEDRAKIEIEGMAAL